MNDIIASLFSAWAYEDGELYGGIKMPYERTDTKAKAEKAFDTALSKQAEAKQMSFTEKDDLCRTATLMAMAYEGQGFLNGFRLGMALAKELEA